MPVNKKYEKLLNLGGIERNTEWENYLKLGFSPEDVPYLIELVSNSELRHAPDPSKEIWVPVHAWRTLGQLRSKQCVEPILALLDVELVEDDWALEELPVVFGMIGPDCIDNLDKFMNESHHDEYARVLAADGLKCIAKDHPEARQIAIAKLTDYIGKANENTIALNGLIVGMLVDLNAKETISAIRDIYLSGQIDNSDAGDLEEVEIGLGLRTERDTPKPLYGQEIFPLTLSTSEQTAEEESDVDLYRSLDKALLDYGNDAAILGSSELDGFFTAVGSSPDIITPSIWISAIWGDESDSPAWPNVQELQTFMSNCISHYNQVMDSLQENYFDPLYLDRKTKGKIIPVFDLWCRGYLRGTKLWPPLNAADTTFFSEKTEFMKSVASSQNWINPKIISEKESEIIEEKIFNIVTDLHFHFGNQHTAPKTPAVKTNKTSRNDPCPCGSGKKYKKCCLH